METFFQFVNFVTESYTHFFGTLVVLAIVFVIVFLVCLIIETIGKAIANIIRESKGCEKDKK